MAGGFEGLSELEWRLFEDIFRVCPTFYTWRFELGCAAHDANRGPHIPCCHATILSVTYSMVRLLWQRREDDSYGAEAVYLGCHRDVPGRLCGLVYGKRYDNDHG